MQRTSLVVLTDVFLQSHVLNYGVMLQEFPFLVAAKNAVDALGSCVKCQRPAKKLLADKALNEAKRAIAKMPDDQKARFKELLNTSEVRVQWQIQVGNATERDRDQF